MKQNPRSLFTTEQIISATNGVAVGLGQKELLISNVQVDSRSCEQGSLFVPLIGERTDGHLFIKQAFEKGSSLCFVNRSYYEKNETDFPSSKKSEETDGLPLIVVEDTLKALQDLARSHLDTCRDALYVAITGSSGKTTTKELVGSMLGEWKKTAVSRGNLNSDIGLPLAAFGVSPQDEIAVFELGMNRAGEIRDLVNIVRPQIAAITNIGTAHIGMLGSQRAIAEEKRAVFSTLDSDGAAVIFEDDDYADFLVEDVKARTVLYGPGTTAGYEGREDLGLDGSLIKLSGREIVFPLIGEHNVLNALCAVSVAREAGCPEDCIARGLENAAPMFGRNEIIGGPVTVIRDCYNANAESTEKAIEFLDALSWTGRKILVIGSMKELGDQAPAKHMAVAHRATISRAARVFLYGDEFEQIDTDDSRLAKTADFEELQTSVLAEIQNGDVVLVKGSRSLGLEKLADLIVATTREAAKC